MARISALLILEGSSAGLFVSTITTGAPSATSVILAGCGTSQWASMKAASVLGGPSRAASAGCALISLRYQAHKIAEPTESLSGDLCPKTKIVIRSSLPYRCFFVVSLLCRGTLYAMPLALSSPISLLFRLIARYCEENMAAKRPWGGMQMAPRAKKALDAKKSFPPA